MRSCSLDLHCKSQNIVAFDRSPMSFALDKEFDDGPSKNVHLSYDVYLIVTSMTPNHLPMF